MISAASLRAREAERAAAGGPALADSPYSSCWEHLQDELRLLDLSLQLELRRQEAQRPRDELDALHGLVLSEGEIAGLLRDAPETPSPEREAPVLRAIDRLRRRIARRLAASGSSRLPIDRLTELFGLDELERRCVLACLAPEVDPKYERIFAYLQDDVSRRKPSADLLLRLMVPKPSERLAARARFESRGSLLTHRLLEAFDRSGEGSDPLLSRALKLDDRIASYLVGLDGLDARLAGFSRLISPTAEDAPLRGAEELERRLFEVVGSHFGSGTEPPDLVIHLFGRYGCGRLALAERISRHLRLDLLVADLRQMPTEAAPFAQSVALLAREATLQPAALCFEGFDLLLQDDHGTHNRLLSLTSGTGGLSRLTWLLGGTAWRPRKAFTQASLLSLECTAPDAARRCRIWSDELRESGVTLGAEAIGELAGKFRLTAGEIHQALLAARDLCRLDARRQLTVDDLEAACRHRASHRLGRLARKIEPLWLWDDIVLPVDPLAELHELAGHVRHKSRVMHEWGFASKLSLGRGVTALFAGTSGTGKTMAAEVLANDLGLDLYKIDLSGVVSKYIGETEKNLDRIFREAEDSNAILFFDEADALFGKRSEVRDAHDRYANIEIAYLLQKMEEYDGIVILATNLKKNIDSAFLRRLRFIIEFPFPDTELRERIWRKIFPPAAPLAADFDGGFLAKTLKITGGNIRNISLRAAYLAAARRQAIGMPILIEAARSELRKMGRLYREADFGPFARLQEER